MFAEENLISQTRTPTPPAIPRRFEIPSALLTGAYVGARLGRGPSDSNSSILYFDFSVFSVIWGICFSLKAKPKR